MTRLRATFQSLSVRNFRVYFLGHVVSASGEWMQRTGQAWLVLELTDSATLLGLTAALQHLPMLLIGPWGGLVADRADKRRLMMWTQGIAGLLAIILGVLVERDEITFWMVLLLALGLGCTSAFDHPAKKTFLAEMVPASQLANAVTLHSIVFNSAKAIGPALAGVLIVSIGLSSSFIGNGLSYLVMLSVLVAIRPADLHPAPRTLRARGQLSEGLRYVRNTPELAGPLFLMAVSGTLAYEWTVTLPLLARYTFGGNAQTYGLMFSTMGAGAVVGGLFVAGWVKAQLVYLFGAAWIFGGLVVVTSLAPTLAVAYVALFALGASSIAFRALATTLLQLNAAPEMRGRVMAILAVALTGSSPIGAPLLGWIGQTAGPRAALALGGVATLIAAAVTTRYVRRGVHPP